MRCVFDIRSNKIQVELYCPQYVFMSGQKPWYVLYFF